MNSTLAQKRAFDKNVEARSPLASVSFTWHARTASEMARSSGDCDPDSFGFSTVGAVSSIFARDRVTGPAFTSVEDTEG